MISRNRTYLVIAILLTLGLGSIAVKIFTGDYSFERIIPQPSYSIDISMTFNGNGEDVVVRTFLPRNESTQTIRNELGNADGLDFRRDTTGYWDRGEWTRPSATGPFRISYSFEAILRSVVFEIDPEIVIPESYPENFEPYLKSTENIQVMDPIIMETIEAIGVEDTTLVLPVLRQLYERVMAMGNRPFKGTTDAVTAARLDAASCNGKSRLFIAMARRLGIPSRLVGGLILNPGSKRTTHQWIEVYVAGHWLPIDALNGHFAQLPGNYLALYRGDEAMFRHSRNIGFDYRYDIRKRTSTNDRLIGFLGRQEFNLYSILNNLLKGNISFSVLQFLLVIPLGVLVVVFSRNVIGINTLGTFLPALMAMAVRGTGLIPGIVAFMLVLGITVLFRFPLEKLGVLHTPKLAILMIIVIFGLLGLTALAGVTNWEAFSTIGAASVFPIAILTITSERLAITIVEEGTAKTAKILLQTLLVMSACYVVMGSVALKAIMVAFPELLFVVIAINLWIGNWTGLRVFELFRFRSLYRESVGGTDA